MSTHYDNIQSQSFTQQFIRMPRYSNNLNLQSDISDKVLILKIKHHRKILMTEIEQKKKARNQCQQYTVNDIHILKVLITWFFKSISRNKIVTINEDILNIIGNGHSIPHQWNQSDFSQLAAFDMESASHPKH